MANIVSQIHSAIDTVVVGQLSGFQKMRQIYQPEQNDLRNAKNSYSILHGAATFAQGITRYYEMNQRFTIQLMTTYVSRLDDANVQTELNTLYDKIDSIFVNLFLSKLAIPTIVLIVNEPTIDEPVILDNQAILIRFGINVRYRNAIA